MSRAALAASSMPRPEQIRTEGQRMLLMVTGSLQAIAREISPKCSPQSVNEWRHGICKPSAAFRPLIDAAFGIPVIAWSQRPSDEAAPPPSEDDEDEAGATSLEDVQRLIKQVRRDRKLPNMLPSERVKLVTAEAGLLKLKADLEARAELSEDRYVREHPAWIRARNVLSATLKQYPEAARAVADALERLGL